MSIPFCYKAETQRARDAIAYRASLAATNGDGDGDESSDDGYIKTVFCNSRKRTRAVQSASASGSGEEGDELSAKRARRALAAAAGMSHRASRLARTDDDRKMRERDPLWETRSTMTLLTAEQTENFLARNPAAEYAGAFGRLMAVASQAMAAMQGDRMGLEPSKDVQRARNAYLESEYAAVVAYLSHDDRGDLAEEVSVFMSESERVMALFAFTAKTNDPDAYPELAAFHAAAKVLLQAAAAAAAAADETSPEKVTAALSAYRAAAELAGDDLPEGARKEMDEHVRGALADTCAFAITAWAPHSRFVSTRE